MRLSFSAVLLSLDIGKNSLHLVGLNAWHNL
jgi:hypothetical protein